MTYHERGSEWHAVRVRGEHFRLRRCVELGRPQVGHDANHRGVNPICAAGEATDLQPLADRVAAPEVTAREALVDDKDWPGLQFLEPPSRDHMQPDRPRVATRHRTLGGRRRVDAGHPRRPLDDEPDAAAAVGGETHGLDAR